jgi:aryl-alcohol dehydrogenase-like predicted oxidoreductase
LTGKYNDGIPESSRGRWFIEELGHKPRFGDRFRGEGFAEAIAKVRQLGAIADDLGVPMVHLALAWCLKNPHVSSVILGATSVEQLKQNLKAIAVVEQLTDEIMGRIERVLTNS